MPSFEECLHIILKEKQLSDEDRQTFNNDAKKIRNYLMSQMKEQNSEFKTAFDGLSLTGSYLDKLKIDLPDEFDMHMKLKLPFNLTPLEDKKRPGFLSLKADMQNHRFLGRNGKLYRHPLQMWIRSLFLNTIRDGIRLKVEERTYLIEYPTYGRGEGVAHTVSAKEVGGQREIWFDFVPAIEFLPEQWPFKNWDINKFDKSWFAVPFGKKIYRGRERSNKYTFMVCAPHWERIVLHDKQNMKNSLRLMKAMRDANELKRLTSYMLKSIYLQEIDKRPLEFWELSMGEILIAMLEVLKKALDLDSLPFFLHKGRNHLDLLPKKLILEYKTKVEHILNSLKLFRHQPDVKVIEIRQIFIR